MKVAVIGYRNHSERILRLLLGFREIDQVYVYHPERIKLESAGVQWSARVQPTSEITDLFGLDAIFITSPSGTHLGYVRTLIDEAPYLYCEKPPASTVQMVVG